MAWWGHVRTRGGGGPALQPVRALAAGLQSPEGHTEPGLAPQTAGGRCSQSIQTRCATPSPCPAAAQVTRPPGTATPKSGEDSTEGAGEEAVPRFRRECGSTCTGTGDGETEPGVSCVSLWAVKKTLSCCKVTKGPSRTLQHDGRTPRVSQGPGSLLCEREGTRGKPASESQTSWSLSFPPPRYEQPKCDNTARAHPARTRDLYKSRQLQGEWARGWAGLGSGRCSALSCGFWGEGAQASLVVKDDLKLRGAVFDLVIVTNGIH